MKIEIYSRKGCVYCNQTKTFLADKNLPYREYIIDQDITRDEVIERFPNQKVVPIIAIDDVVIGSWSEMLDYFFPPMKTEEDDNGQ